MAVLSAVTVVMPVSTLVLLWTVEERPTAVSQGANALTHTWETKLKEGEITSDKRGRNITY